MSKYRILVFPCGSEIGLEIFRSLRYSRHIELIGGSSIDDHGKFVYENYIDGIPFIDSDDIISHLQRIVAEKKIDAIYPTMDKVIWKLKINEGKLGCKVISSPAKTTEICLSKSKTYEYFKNIIKVPTVYNSVEQIDSYPVFIKPDIGYGTRDVLKANNKVDIEYYIDKIDNKNFIITEFLPGDEYTVDCFTNRVGDLIFCGPRRRNRIENGISVNTQLVEENIGLFHNIAVKINNNLKLQGAWFFQVKQNKNGQLTLLEVASRLGGSSSLARAQGINFPLLSVFDAFEEDVNLIQNDYYVEIDRALDIKYKTDLKYFSIYVDLDDCLISNGKVNHQIVSFIYKAINEEKEVILLTKHIGNVNEELSKYRLASLFDEIIHINREDEKYKYIDKPNSIFIDDSFEERRKVRNKLGISVFSPDMIEVLAN